jgi:hypothetical protein
MRSDYGIWIGWRRFGGSWAGVKRAASPRHIETIPRVGYRFIAPVSNGHRPLTRTVEIEPSPQLPDGPGDEPSAVPAADHRTRWWMSSDPIYVKMLPNDKKTLS